MSCQHRMKSRTITPIAARPKRRMRSAPLGAALLVLASLSIGLAAGCGTVPRDLASQIEAARTPDDHEAIARSLVKSAERYASDARRHRELTARYEVSGWVQRRRHHDSLELRISEHCRRVAENLERAAGELTEMAREHEELAREMAGKSE